MTDHENTWDKLLKIKTTGRDDTNADGYRYPYEPTPYCVLERLSSSGLFGKKDTVLNDDLTFICCCFHTTAIVNDVFFH